MRKILAVALTLGCLAMFGGAQAQDVGDELSIRAACTLDVLPAFKQDLKEDGKLEPGFFESQMREGKCQYFPNWLTVPILAHHSQFEVSGPVTVDVVIIYRSIDGREWFALIYGGPL